MSTPGSATRQREDAGTTADPGERGRVERRGARRHVPAAHQYTKLLFRRYRRSGDAVARETLVERHLSLARGLARRYSRSSEPYEELVQVASLALVKAVERFDPDRGTEFRAFAIPTILGELKRHFRDSAWAVHVPRSTQERALVVEEANNRLAAKLGRSPTVDEVAGDLGMGRESVLDGLAAAAAYATRSLDETSGGGRSAFDSGETTIGETLGADDERYELIEADIAIADAARRLPRRERQILHLRFVNDLTQSEIAAEIGISQMQVSRLLRTALAQLRDLTAASGAAVQGVAK
jgi:RNA polymerase sigma-B factor